MKKVINASSNCIDIGCHKGEILEVILKLSPKGKHFCFEPIPLFYNQLVNQYSDKATIYPYALADKEGKSTFQFVKNAPAYSGLNKRKYEVANPDIEEINVEIKTLDQLIPTDVKIDFIKIDVEGAEYGVLKGAKQLLSKNKPIVVFECGLGASDYYGTKPADIFNIMNEVGLYISTLKAFIKNEQPFDLASFEKCYENGDDYYFIAHP